jgi:lipoate-protein ligase A
MEACSHKHRTDRRAWRFLPYSEHGAALNMAIDEAIMEAHTEGLVPPTLRLYGFRPSAVTIGLSQQMPPATVQRIQDRGIDVVRRPTGGRAVLHHNDLTYSVVAPSSSAPAELNGFLSDSVTESYKQICAGLIAAFAQLGLESGLGDTGLPYRHLQDCFMATTGCDLHHKGTKLIGSAQVRRRGVILQHGSAPLDQDPSMMAQLLDEPLPEKSQRHLNLFTALNRQIAFEEFEEAFIAGFQQAFDVTITRDQLTKAELDRALELKEQKTLQTAVRSKN